MIFRHPAPERPATVPETGNRWKRQIRLYLFYRFVLASGLLFGFFTGLGPAFLGRNDPQLHWLTLATYMVLNLASLLIDFLDAGNTQSEYFFAVVVDSLVIATLMHTSGGPGSGLGILLGISIAFASQGLSSTGALIAAGIATAAVLTEEVFSVATGQRHHTAYFTTALLGLSYFALAVLSVELADRAQATERLVRQQGRDISNLTALNEQVIQRLQTGVVVVDDQNRIKLLNDAAWELLGRPKAAIGDLLHKIHPKLALTLERWRRQPTSKQYQIHSQTQTKDLLANFQRLGPDTGSQVLAFIDDASRAAAQAQQLKLASLGRLVAGIAHEIRNPLGAIGHANQLLRESPLEGTERRMTEIIDRNTRRLNQVVENILSLSRQRTPQPKSVLLSHWLHELGEEMRETHHLQKEQIQVQPPPEEIEIRLDPQQIRQVLEILVENSVRHQHEMKSELLIVLHGGIDDSSGSAYLQVTDNGKWIPSGVVDKIFDPFFTTSNQGTGLGLYLAKELCDANRVHLGYRPIPTGGNCFHLRFGPEATGTQS